MRGMIITRTGETLIVSNPQGKTSVVLTDDTTTKDNRGLFGLEEQQMGNTVRHIVAPGAMGEYGAKAPNETAAGRAENRRIEVKVLVNKGISGA